MWQEPYEEKFNCIVCDKIILEEEYIKNHGLCDNCEAHEEDEFYR